MENMPAIVALPGRGGELCEKTDGRRMGKWVADAGHCILQLIRSILHNPAKDQVYRSEWFGEREKMSFSTHSYHLGEFAELTELSRDLCLRPCDGDGAGIGGRAVWKHRARAVRQDDLLAPPVLAGGKAILKLA